MREFNERKIIASVLAGGVWYPTCFCRGSRERFDVNVSVRQYCSVLSRYIEAVWRYWTIYDVLRVYVKDGGLGAGFVGRNLLSLPEVDPGGGGPLQLKPPIPIYDTRMQ